VTSFAPNELSVEDSTYDGPRYLKKYLEYCFAISGGNKEIAKEILLSFGDYANGSDNVKFDSEFENMVYDELVDRGVRHIEDKLLKDDSQKLFYGLLKNLGAVIIRKTVKNFIAKIIPLVGAVSGTIICTAENYRKMRCLGRRTERYYRE
jgi:hypothetical protein